ncbi:MAG: tetratricopeptide repeat protein [Acidobacteriota bacterium]|nr:tetratricopeptide repeat protein [Acidobacteriota bacterium]
MRRPGPGRRRSRPGGCGILPALLTIAALLLPPRIVAAPAPRLPALRRERVLVLPFRDVQRIGRIYWLTEAAAELLTDDLQRSGFAVVSRDDRRRAFDRLQVPVDAPLTDATAIRIGRLVGATQVVLGTLRLETGGPADTLVADARRIRIEAGRLDGAVSERAPLPDLFTLFARLARRLAPSTAPDEAALVDGHPPLVAFEDYVKGLLAQDPKTQTRYLESSLALDPHLDRARLALWSLDTDRGDDAQALGVVQAVPSGSRVATRAQFRQALSLMHLKRYADAWAVLSDLATRDPVPTVLNNLGAAALEQSGPEWTRRAAYDFSRAAGADPDNADYCFNLGYTYWRQQNPTAAIHWLREAVRRNPADGDAHFVLAAALRAAGRTVEADRERALAHQLSSTYVVWERRADGRDPVPPGIERLAPSLDGPLRVQTAITDTREADRQTTAAFYLAQARTLYARQDDREATAALKRCLFLSPYEAGAQLLLGRIYLRERRIPDAIAALKISLWSAETADAHAALARAYLQAGRQDRARAEAKRALALDPGQADARAILAGLDRAGAPGPTPAAPARAKPGGGPSR